MASGRSIGYGILFFVAYLYLGQIQAEDVVLKPVADTSLLEQYPTNNLGRSTRLHVGSVPEGRSRSLIRFDLNSLTASDKVVFAALKFNTFAAPYPRGSENIAAFRVLRNWDEGVESGLFGAGAVDGATWNFPQTSSVPWQEPGSAYSYEFHYLISAQVNAHNFGETVLSGMGLARDVQSWIDQPASNFGWLLANPGESTLEITFERTNYYPNLAYIASREDAELAPELTVYLGNTNAPRVFVNGEYASGAEPVLVDLARPRGLTLESPFVDGRIFYTLDGSRPGLGSNRYTAGANVQLEPGAIIRAVTYSADYSQGGVEAEPVRIELLPRYLLTLSVGEGGSVQGNDEAARPGPFSGVYTSFTSNSVVNLRAVPLPGWAFTGWTGDLTNSETNIVVTMDRPKELGANFVPIVAERLSVRQVESEWIVLQFESQPSFNYVVQSSTNLQNWVDQQSYSNHTGVVDAILPFEPSAATRFYRLTITVAGTSGIPPY
jgi:uncharacterized repeat protein (TIGR02543 family)